MPDSVLLAHVDTQKFDYNQLQLLPAPQSTSTHQIIPHHEVVNALVETLGFRHIGVHKMEFAVDKTGNKMFGLLELDQTFTGCRFALGIRNSHDKTMRLAMTVGYRVFVCDNMSFNGDFSPVLAKHTKHFNLTRSLAVGIDDCQRNFDPMVKAVERWRGLQITEATAKLLIYDAFIEGAVDLPRHLARPVHEAYFNPQVEEFQARTMWALQNAFTGAIKQLDPIPAFKATAATGAFFEKRKL